MPTQSAKMILAISVLIGSCGQKKEVKEVDRSKPPTQQNAEQPGDTNGEGKNKSLLTLELANLVEEGANHRHFVRTFELQFKLDLDVQPLIDDGTITKAISIINLGISADKDADQALELSASQFQFNKEMKSLKWSYSSFSSPAESVPEGYYEIVVDSQQFKTTDGNPLDGNGSGQAGGKLKGRFHRLLGDMDKNGAVDSKDDILFRSLLGKGSTRCDLNGDGATNDADQSLMTQALTDGKIVTPSGSGPQVANLEVMDGAAQRSIVDSFAITFDRKTNIASLIANDSFLENFTLTNLGVDSDAEADSSIALSAAQFSYDDESNTLTFSSSSFAARTLATILPSGAYRIVLSSDGIEDDSNLKLNGHNGTLEGGDWVGYFLVLRGDLNGDGITNLDSGEDKTVHDNALTTYDYPADFDLDGTVGNDLEQAPNQTIVLPSL